MIQCPNCRATLPDWQTRCQFCQADTAKVARPVHVKKQYKNLETSKWVWAGYYGISTWWVIDGGLDIFNTINSVNQQEAAAQAAKTLMQQLMHPHPSVFSYFGVVWGACTILFGLGLIARLNFIRGIVNFFSALKLLIGLCGIVGTLIAGLIAGPWTILFLLLHMFTVVTAALMIYLIGETDRQAYI